jgi:hypothetical protein
MKKTFFVFIPMAIVFLITACAGVARVAGSGNRAVSASPTTGQDTLNTEIKNAAGYLNTRIPAGGRVAFVNIAGGYPDLANYILNGLSRYAVNSDKYSVVDRARLDDVRAELNLNLSGEVSDSSAQAVGQMLGAQTIVSGSVQKIGTMYSLDIKAIEVQTATVQGQWSANIPNGATIAALTENYAPSSSGGAAVAGGARPAGGGQAAAPQGPADGTYSFWPRIQAFQGARAVSVYLDKIVVMRGYMTIYIYATTQGNGGYTESLIGNWSNASLKDMESNRSARLVDAVHKAGVVYGSVTICELSFRNVTGTRLILDSADNPPIEFYDIILEEPDN